jgi:ferredoxin
VAVAHRARVDPITCDGHGLCAELLPERISLDDWGYPIVPREPIDDGDALQHATQAVALCPRQALQLTSEPDRH